MGRVGKRTIGEFVHLVDVRNSDLSINNLIGVGLEKEFFPSIANIIGTDLSNYKVIKKNQFGCKFMSVGRDGILPVSLYLDDIPSIISSAYYVFEINDESELLPAYLMMWLRRSEFDRELWFYSGGDVRGGINWEDLCETSISVPSINEQKRIVAEYQATEARIATNGCLIQELVETARAVYKKMFVDNIDHENLPSGWSIGSVSSIATLKVGGDKPAVFSTHPTMECTIPVYANGTEDEGLFGYTNKAAILDRSVTITARGTIGCCFLRKAPYFPIVRLIIVLPKKSFYEHYLFQYFSAAKLQGDGSVQSQLTVPQLLKEQILIPEESVIKEYHDIAEPLDQYIAALNKENKVLLEVQRVLLSKMS